MKTKKHNSPAGRFLMHSLNATVLLFLLLFMPFRSGAQIVYTDIVPDTTITRGHAYEFDMNLDGLADFTIAVTSDSLFPLADIKPLHDSCFVDYFMVDGCAIAEALELNDSINEAGFLNNFPSPPPDYLLGYQGASYCMYPGHFIGKTDKYAGLKLTRNGHNQYAWLRMDVASDASQVTLKDFAFSGTEMLAGQTISKVDPSRAVKSRLIVSENSIEVNIRSVAADMEISAAKLINAVSQQSRLTIDHGQVRMVKSGYPNGLFLLKIQTTMGPYIVKILINN